MYKGTSLTMEKLNYFTFFNLKKEYYNLKLQRTKKQETKQAFNQKKRTFLLLHAEGFLEAE